MNYTEQTAEITEDRLVGVLIDCMVGEDREAFPEAHYNYYGDRGVVDLASIGKHGATLYEVKSESAVRGATGANEILRQFNRMRQNFFRGSDHKAPEPLTSEIPATTFELCFAPTAYNLEHLEKNKPIYRQAMRNSPNVGQYGEKSGSQLTLRFPDPDEMMPVLVANNRSDIWDELEDRRAPYGGSCAELFEHLRVGEVPADVPQ